MKDNALMSTPLDSRNSIISKQSVSLSKLMSALCIVLLCVSRAPEEMSKSMVSCWSGPEELAAESRAVWPHVLIRFGFAPWSRNHFVRG